MKILYKNAAAERQFSSKYKSKWRYPEQVKKKLLVAENYISDSDSLKDIVSYSPFRFEHLRGNTGYRVTMIPCDDKGNEIVEGDIITQCKSIKIIKITEVSNHYE